MSARHKGLCSKKDTNPYSVYLSTHMHTEVCLLSIDSLVKSRKTPLSVIPAKAGIQFIQIVTKALDSGFHRSDDFLRFHQY